VSKIIIHQGVYVAKSLLRISNPTFLFLSVLTYTFGAGIAHYLGRSVSIASFGLGLLASLTLLCAAFLLEEYFRLLLVPLVQRVHFRTMLLQVSYAALTLSAIAFLTLLLTHSLNLIVGILYALEFLFILAYSVPPLRLSKSGYGELVLAVFLGTLIPALAFVLQYGQLHRLLSFASFPLTLLALAYLLVGNFPTFATDQKLGNQTLLTRLKWQSAIPIHHFLVLAAFLLFAAAPFLEYPWRLVWPVFLALPFAVIQMIWLQQIANGGRTLWSFFTALASGTFGLTAYLLALTFWIR
jgi:1,4-dihydroxy-2-naphthoate octaprenyltransferase